MDDWEAFQMWLQIWLEGKLTYQNFMRLDDEELAGLLVKDMLNAGFIISKDK